MLNVQFRCRVLTPMFLGGANPRAAPELRAPSVKGILRYWYRALLGARGVRDPDELLERTALVFGSTERASSLRVRISNPDVEDKPAGAFLRNEGASYLWHYAKAAERRGIVPGESFQVHLSLLPRPNELSPEVTLQEAVRAFWLLTHLGGLGTRSRRLAGALRAGYVKRPKGVDLPSFSPQQPFEDWFRRQLASLSLEGNETTGSAVDHLGQARVWIGAHRFDYCSQGIDVVGTTYQDFRNHLSDGEKVGFGLPIEQGDDEIRVERSSKKVERRASPLWMQFVEDASGQYRTVFTLFGGSFLTDSHDLTVNGRPFDRVFRQRASDFVAKRVAAQVYPA